MLGGNAMGLSIIDMHRVIWLTDLVSVAGSLFLQHLWGSAGEHRCGIQMNFLFLVCWRPKAGPMRWLMRGSFRLKTVGVHSTSANTVIAQVTNVEGGAAVVYLRWSCF